MSGPAVHPGAPSLSVSSPLYWGVVIIWARLSPREYEHGEVMPRDHLKVLRGGTLLDVTLTTQTVPACEVGPSHKKYYYQISSESMGWAYTKREAFDLLMKKANAGVWKVFQPLN